MASSMRALRPLRTLPLLVRPGLRNRPIPKWDRRYQSSLPSRDELLRDGKVKFYEGSTGRKIVTSLVGIAFYGYLYYILLNTLASVVTIEKLDVPQKPKSEKQEQQEGEELPEGEEQIDDSDEEPYFFKCIWPPKRVNEGHLYPKDDPDWQSLKAFARDAKKEKEVIARVLNEINHSANILYSKHFGSNIKCEPLLMYFNLNRKLPDEYEAIGLEFRDESVTLATKIISANEYRNWMQGAWPTMMGGAFYAFGKRLFELKKAKVSASWQFVKDQWHEIEAEQQAKIEAVPDDHWRKRLARTPRSERNPDFMRQIQKEKREEMIKEFTTILPDSAAKAEKRVEDLKQQDREGSEAGKQPSSSTSGDADKHTQTLDYLLSYFRPGSDLFEARKAFLRRMMEEKSRWSPERGYIKLSGVVKLQGPKGNYPFEVIAYYNPKTNDLKMQYLPRP